MQDDAEAPAPVAFEGKRENYSGRRPTRKRPMGAVYFFSDEKDVVEQSSDC